VGQVAGTTQAASIETAEEVKMTGRDETNTIGTYLCLVLVPASVICILICTAVICVCAAKIQSYERRLILLERITDNVSYEATNLKLDSSRHERLLREVSADHGVRRTGPLVPIEVNDTD